MDKNGDHLDKVTMPPQRMKFETLRANNRGTVSDRLPLFCFVDSASQPDLQQGYLHVDFMSVYVAREGTGVHLVEDVPYMVRAGDVYAMGYGMAHRFAESDGLVLDAVHFIPSMFSPEIQNTLAQTEGLAPMFLGQRDAESSRWLRLSKAAQLQATDMLRELREEWSVDAPDRALMVQSTFLRFLVFLARCHRDTHQSTLGIGTWAKSVIDRRYAEPLKIADLAASAFLSTGRFTERFREDVGCSPREYLGQVRIRAAQSLLRASTLSIAAIAEQTGFPDPAYFTRFFRQEVGVSPSEYRNESR